MIDDRYTIAAYAAYIGISALLTLWVAKTLHKNGRIFLVDAFGGREDMADSVNHLLVVGFYLINIGYVTLALRLGNKPADMRQAIEFLSTKIGWVLVVLGVMHFMNMAIFKKMKVDCELHNANAPVQPDENLSTATGPKLTP